MGVGISFLTSQATLFTSSKSKTNNITKTTTTTNNELFWEAQ